VNGRYPLQTCFAKHLFPVRRIGWFGSHELGDGGNLHPAAPLIDANTTACSGTFLNSRMFPGYLYEPIASRNERLIFNGALGLTLLAISFNKIATSLGRSSVRTLKPEFPF
jgi:hypothetical protein